MQSIAFLVLENHGQIPSYNVIPAHPETGVREDPDDTRGRNINKLFPSHGKPIINLNQIQNYNYLATKGLTPDDAQFPYMQSAPGANAFWFLDPSEPRVDLSVYENDNDQYTNYFHGYSGTVASAQYQLCTY